MKSSEEHWIRSFGGLFRCFPKLLLWRISVHGTYSKKAVSKLFWNIWEITRLRAHHHSVIHKPEIYEEDVKKIISCDAAEDN